MAGNHCTDCLFSKIERSQKNDEFYGVCEKGYTLTNRDPHECELPNFALKADSLFPTKDPFGKLYLGRNWVCPAFRPRDPERGRG